MLASEFVDDELDRDETMRLVDHLTVCEGCRGFYGRVRSLDEALTGSQVAAVPPGRMWKRIESQVRPRPAMPAWGLRAAAAILVGILVWQVAQLRFTPLEESGPIEVTLEESKGSMTDTRFIELTSEVLRADRRYHTAMLQVMTEIQEATGNSRVTEESTSSEGETEESGGEIAPEEIQS